jgi:CO/xanthine dehydrogenase FAD-binding subunit
MITAYHRPQTLDEALTLLTQPNILPLGGGTLLAHGTADSVQVVDLQLLGLNSLTKTGNNLELGATLTLQALLESADCPAALKSSSKPH